MIQIDLLHIQIMQFRQRNICRIKKDKQTSFYTSFMHKREKKDHTTYNTKALQLQLRLKSGTRSTQEYSHMGSRCVSRQSKMKASNIWELREYIDTLFTQNSQQIESLTVEVNQLLLKQRQCANWSKYSISVQTEMQHLSKSIDEAKFIYKYRHSLFGAIYQRPNLKASSIANQKSRKETLNSIIRDSSLLLSFKKNLQQDEGHITLKYSEQSNKQQREGEDVLSHNRIQSFAKCDPLNKRLSFKGPFEPVQSSNDSIQKDAIKGYTQMQEIKTKVEENRESILLAINTYEQVIDKFIQAIAQEKVQRDQQATAIINQIYSQFASLHSIINEYHHTPKDKSQCLFQQVGDKIFLQLQGEKEARGVEQKGMIRMILKVVQYLQ